MHIAAPLKDACPRLKEALKLKASIVGIRFVGRDGTLVLHELCRLKARNAPTQCENTLDMFCKLSEEVGGGLGETELVAGVDAL